MLFCLAMSRRCSLGVSSAGVFWNVSSVTPSFHCSHSCNALIRSALNAGCVWIDSHFRSTAVIMFWRHSLRDGVLHFKICSHVSVSCWQQGQLLRMLPLRWSLACIGWYDTMYQFYDMSVTLDMLLDALAVCMPIDGVENCCRPLVPFSNVFPERFGSRLVSKCRFIVACHRARGEDEVCPTCEVTLVFYFYFL